MTRESYQSTPDTAARNSNPGERGFPFRPASDHPTLPPMKNPLTALTVALLTGLSLPAAESGDGKLLFSDDFERSESDESKEMIGNGWTTNSRTRAKGRKQVDLRDGAIHIVKADVADHGVSVVHEAAFGDATIRCRFKLGKGDDLGINLADMQEKSVHAGHICMARVRLNRLEIVDLKTGRMKREHRDARQAGKETAAMKKLVNQKSKYFDLDLAADEWHSLEVRIDGGRMTVKIDDREAGAFTSPGIGHPTKSRIRLAVNKAAWVDDVAVWRR